MERVRELWSAYVDKTMVFFSLSPSLKKGTFLVMKKGLNIKTQADVFVCKFHFFFSAIISAFTSVKVSPRYRAREKKCKLIESVEGRRGIKTGKFFLLLLLFTCKGAYYEESFLFLLVQIKPGSCRVKKVLL